MAVFGVVPVLGEVLTCQPSGTRNATEDRPSGSRGGAFTETSTVNGVPGRTSNTLVRSPNRVPSGAVPLALVSAPSRTAVGAAAAALPGAGNGTRASTCVKKSQPSWAGSDGTSGKPAQPWEAYTRCASRSTAAHVRPRLGEVRPLHTPNTFCAAFAGRNVEAQSGPVREVPRAPPVSRRAGAKGRRPSSRSCSGNASGSAAARNASTASRAASWWLPWLPGVGAGSMVSRISGRVRRTSRTTFSRVSPPHTWSVSGALTV
ncbi:hypothetical protein [Nonomuraea rubra]|uniref:hypothetical protein n=1 Tax=Nonomuraea rubra TaxID=46180 RepID=UPI00360E28B7